MRVPHWLAMLSVLAFSGTVSAQQHPGRATHPGGMTPHPGQMHPGPGQPNHALTAQQQHEHMIQQFWQEQMMLNQMMSSPRARGRHSNSQAGASQSQSGTGGRPHGANPDSLSGQPGRNQNAQSKSSGSEQRHTEQKNSEKSKHEVDEAKQRRHEGESELVKNHNTTANASKRQAQVADSQMIGHLRTVHGRLVKADGDYAGHRVRAMEHVAAAAHQLGSSSPLITNGASAGNLAQPLSDEILRNALHSLKTIEGSLGSGMSTAAHHHSAHASISEAIRELHLALNIN
jgi:hypothetical protein